MVSKALLDAVAYARSDAQSNREYVDWILAAAPGWEFGDIRFGPGHGGYGLKLYAGSEVIDINASSLDSAAVLAIDKALELHGVGG